MIAECKKATRKRTKVFSNHHILYFWIWKLEIYCIAIVCGQIISDVCILNAKYKKYRGGIPTTIGCFIRGLLAYLAWLLNGNWALILAENGIPLTTCGSILVEQHIRYAPRITTLARLKIHSLYATLFIILNYYTDNEPRYCFKVRESNPGIWVNESCRITKNWYNHAN